VAAEPMTDVIAYRMEALERRMGLAARSWSNVLALIAAVIGIGYDGRL